MKTKTFDFSCSIVEKADISELVIPVLCPIDITLIYNMDFYSTYISTKSYQTFLIGLFTCYVFFIWRNEPKSSKCLS